MSRTGFYIVLLLIFKAMSSKISLAQNTPVLTTSYFGKEVTRDMLPAEAKYVGDFLAGYAWMDEGGENIFIFSGKNYGGEGQNEIFACQYINQNGKLQKSWEIKDYSTGNTGIEFIDNSLQVIDLDGDGLMETSFMYRETGSKKSDMFVKLLMHTKSNKLAVRGKISPEGKEKGMDIDMAFNDHPYYMTSFAKQEWKEFFRDGEISQAKSMVVIRPDFRLMAFEYLFASGGITYELQDKDGLEMGMDKKIRESLKYAQDIDLMPDGMNLFYTSLPTIGMFNAVSGENKELVRLLDNTEAISPTAWNEAGDKVAFVTLNFDEYPKSTRIFVLTLANDELVNKQKFDAQVMKAAGGAWYIDPVEWVDDHTIRYREQTDDGDAGEMKEIKVN